jgi:hypothetical protein
LDEGKELSLWGKDDSAGAWSYRLSAGKFKLILSYEHSRTEKDMDHWAGKVQTEALEVEVKAAADPAKEESKPVRVDGVDFQVVADRRWPLPAEGKQQTVAIQLRVTNTTDKDVHFLIWEQPTVELTTADGKKLEWGYGRNGTAPVMFMLVEAGKSRMFSRTATLYGRVGDTFPRVEGRDNSGGLWYYTGIGPGKYKLTVAYANKQAKGNDLDLWVGKVVTEAVEVEIPNDVAAAPLSKEKAVTLAQAAAEQALDGAYAKYRNDVKVQHGIDRPEHEGYWIRPKDQLTITEKDGILTVRWQNAAKVGFYYDVTIEVSTHGQVKVVSAQAGFSPK